jgi:hypothetical protein
LPLLYPKDLGVVVVVVEVVVVVLMAYPVVRTASNAVNYD